MIVESLRDLVARLEASSIPYAIGGAFALGVWATPRATRGIDVTLFVGRADVADVLTTFLGWGAKADLPTGIAQARQDGLAVLQWKGLRLDAFFPSIPFYDEALQRRVRTGLAMVGPTWVLSAEVLSVFKLLFFRPKDLLDLAQIYRVQGQRLDASYVRAQLVNIVGDTDDRVRWWDQLTSPPAA